MVSMLSLFLIGKYFIKKVSKKLTQNYKGMERVEFENHTSGLS